jgi:hypothetical protein
MRFFSWLCALSSLGLLTSCSLINYYSAYDANSLNIPLHKEKREIKGSAGYGSILGFNADASYAVTRNLSVKAGANYNHQDLVRNRLLGGNRFTMTNHYLESAAGYYKYLENPFINSLELSAGYGNGLTDQNLGGGRFNGRFHKYFLQFNVGHVSDKIEFGIGVRYSGIYYPVLRQKVWDEYTFEPVNYQYSNLRLPSLECAVMSAFGGKKLKATVQYGLAFPLKEIRELRNRNAFTNYKLNYWSAIFQVGIRYNFLLAKEDKI